MRFNVENFLLRNFKFFWKLVDRTPWLSSIINKVAINTLADSTQARPLPYSMYSHEPRPQLNFEAPTPTGSPEYWDHRNWHVSDYTSWQSLTDKTFSNRHLGPAEQAFMDSLPNLQTVTDFMMRNGKKPVLSNKSSVLFPGFAQWFTDAFLRTAFPDLRKNTSTHEIDLCQIYGLDEKTTNILRSGKGGKLKCQNIEGQEYPPYLFDDKLQVKEEFQGLPYLHQLPHIYRDAWKDENRRRKFYVTGLERGNTTITHSAFNTLFLRCHNKVVGELQSENPSWKDERLFQTTRNIMICILIKIVVEDYINHISPVHFSFKTDTSFAEKKDWYRTNWISTEFNLLYRWHSLVPDSIKINNQVLNTETDFNLNNEKLENMDLGDLFAEISQQKSGKIVSGNVPDFLRFAEMKSLLISRISRLRSYNEYRERYDLKPLKRMQDLTSNPDHLNILNKLYQGDIDKVELTVGLFTEETDQVLGELLTVMVGSDAFTHALTNPLLSKHIFNKETFSEKGLKIIEKYNSLSKLIAYVEGRSYEVSFDLPTDS